MNATGEAILTHPQPCGHLVYPYNDEAHFAEAVCLFVSTGLRKGGSALLVMEDSHYDTIREHLQAEGLDIAGLGASGRLICVAAEALMATVVFDGIIDEHVFKTKVGRLIERAKVSSSDGEVRVFGEMVNLMWMPHPKATLRLEELWNDIIKQHSVPLLCAYSLGGARPDSLPKSLLACHSQTIT